LVIDVPVRTQYEAGLALDQNRAEPEVAVQILNYFGRNPQAVDSLEGIVRWRLMQEQIHRTVRETELALEWLVQRGFVSEERRVSAGALYKLNPEKIEEIQEFLERVKSRSNRTDEGTR
jgi:hypothetical protein